MADELGAVLPLLDHVAEKISIERVIELSNLALQRRTGVVVGLLDILDPRSDDTVQSFFPRIAPPPLPAALPGLDGNPDEARTEQGSHRCKHRPPTTISHRSLLTLPAPRPAGIGVETRRRSANPGYSIDIATRLSTGPGGGRVMAWRGVE